MTWQLKGGRVEPEETTRQRHSKQVSAAMGMHAAVEERFEEVFSTRSVPSL
jgi:hypothetical protein